MQRFFQPSDVTILTIPVIPSEVKFNQLNDDLKLLGNSERIAVRTLVDEGEDDTYYPKEKTGFSYDILYQNGQIWVVSEVIAKGSHGAVRTLQNDKTGMFCIYKHTDEVMQREYEVLSDVGLSNSPLLMHKSKLAAEDPSQAKKKGEQSKTSMARLPSPMNSPTFRAFRQKAQTLLGGNKKFVASSPKSKRSMLVQSIFPVEPEHEVDHQEGQELKGMVHESGVVMTLVPGMSAERVNNIETVEIINPNYTSVYDKDKVEIENDCKPDMSFYSPVLRLQFMISIVEELYKLHSAGVIHRDLAPGNVMLDWITQRAGFVDFGQSARLENGVVIDTLKGSSLTYPFEFRDEFNRIITAFANTGSGEPFAKLTYSPLTDAAEAAVLLAVVAQLIKYPDMVNKASWGHQNFIVDKDHEYCQNNLCFPKEVAEELVDLLQGVFDANLTKRQVAWDSLRDDLMQIKNKYFAKEKLDVAIIDFDELANATPQQKLELFDEFSTQGIREVWLIDTNPTAHTLKQYAELQKEFLNVAAVYVGSQVYGGPADKAKKALEADLDKRPVKSNCIVMSPIAKIQHTP